MHLGQGLGLQLLHAKRLIAIVVCDIYIGALPHLITSTTEQFLRPPNSFTFDIFVSLWSSKVHIELHRTCLVDKASDWCLN